MEKRVRDGKEYEPFYFFISLSSPYDLMIRGKGNALKAKKFTLTTFGCRMKYYSLSIRF